MKTATTTRRAQYLRPRDRFGMDGEEHTVQFVVAYDDDGSVDIYYTTPSNPTPTYMTVQRDEVFVIKYDT